MLEGISRQTPSTLRPIWLGSTLPPTILSGAYAMGHIHRENTRLLSSSSCLILGDVSPLEAPSSSQTWEMEQSSSVRATASNGRGPIVKGLCNRRTTHLQPLQPLQQGLPPAVPTTTLRHLTPVGPSRGRPLLRRKHQCRRCRRRLTRAFNRRRRRVHPSCQLLLVPARVSHHLRLDHVNLLVQRLGQTMQPRRERRKRGMRDLFRNRRAVF